MDGGEGFRALLRSVEEQYENDIHEVRCARRSKMSMNHPGRRSFGSDSQAGGTPKVSVVDASQKDVQTPVAPSPSKPSVHELEIPPELPEHPQRRSSVRLSDPLRTNLKPKRASFVAQPRSSRRTSFADSRNERSDFESDELQVLQHRGNDSQRSSIRSSLSSDQAAARTGFNAGRGRRTLFFDKSPEEMEAMFQEALNEEEEDDDSEPAVTISRRDWLGGWLGRSRAKLKQMLETDGFEMLISTCILCNVVVMCCVAQYRGLDIGYNIVYPGMTRKAEELWPGLPHALQHLDTFFTVIFSLELLLRLIVYRLAFFTLALNWLDFSVVFFSLIELLASSVPGSSTVLRLVRLAKLARGLRVVRMARVMDSLHLLLKSIGASFSMLLWSMLLIGVIQCTAGMIIGYLVMDHLEQDTSQPEEVRHLIYRYYGTFTYTILTMFEVIFANWPIPCRILVDHVDEWYSMFFIIYRCVVGFCVLNVVGAVFVQQTMKLAADDHDLFMQQQTRAAEAYTRKIKDVFTKLDMSGEGYIYMEEFVEILNTPTMSHFMAKLELESTDLLSLFKLIDVDDSGQVSLEDFMTGCQRLKGPAKSVDLALLLAHTARLNCKVDNVLNLVGGEAGMEDWGYGAAGDVKLEQRFLRSASMIRGSTHARDTRSTTSMDSLVPTVPGAVSDRPAA
ncbi:unnamed protein product [Symbiodinium natans]|uniref:EF-hand domain-containing protein n=1 Tax=Symbiodinium natans TaxID=878477 RepID=A0A812V4D6_9DINO|nr:unnamed protein product [Symbiodinium natans]